MANCVKFCDLRPIVRRTAATDTGDTEHHRGEDVAAMARVREWFGFGEEEQPKSAQEHSRFNYSAHLLPGLKGDHAELLKLYVELERMAIEGRYASIPASLGTFKSKLDVHLLNENLHFYCYVEEKALGEREKELIRGFRAEMNGIARSVLNFVKVYRQAGVHPANGQTFLSELRLIGGLLVQRIEREEEELYALYRP
jgi:hypothetical protein